MPRLNHVIAAAATAIALTGAVSVPAVAAQRPTAHQPAASSAQYYLSLGDSLSVGDQPNAKGVTLPTNQGYADQLYNVLKRDNHNLVLAKLGCPAETSHTMNLGGICGYKGDVRYSLTAAKGAQLAAALAFLRAHSGHVPLITIDMGANDLNKCIDVPNPTITGIIACLTPVFPVIAKNLAFTLAKLRAADPKAAIVGMSYYDPELATWLEGTTASHMFAGASIALARAFNDLLEGDYAAAHMRFADVFTAFDTADMKDMVSVPGIGKLPKDVALICEWTWECVPPPVGPNEHGNKAGYAVMSAAFLTSLRRLHYPV